MTTNAEVRRLVRRWPSTSVWLVLIVALQLVTIALQVAR